MSLRVEVRHERPPLDLRLELPEGAITSVVGPSGSGKTSTLRLVAGLWAPSEGSITFGGTTWFASGANINLPPRDRSIGVVPQRYALFPHLTARQNVEAALLHLPGAQRTPRAEAALARAHVAGLGARYPHELSGGQQQRVAVAGIHRWRILASRNSCHPFYGRGTIMVFSTCAGMGLRICRFSFVCIRARIIGLGGAVSCGLPRVRLRRGVVQPGFTVLTVGKAK